VSFTPGFDGGSPILAYAVFAQGDRTTVLYSSYNSPVPLTSQSIGTTNYDLLAQNASGFSTGVSFSVEIRSPPTIPEWGTATISWVGGNGTATVTFTAPSNDGGSAITAYRVYNFSTGSLVASNNGTVAPITVTGLTNGVTYNFVLKALNSVGLSSDADAYNVTPTAGGGGGGDPYVTTFSNISYKLPTLDAPIRYFQTMEGGKLLTVNAQLKTVEREAMSDDALRSLILLRKKMSVKQYAVIAAKLAKPETLCFFERISIQHGDQRLVVNLWDSKFEVVENSLRCSAEMVDRPDLLLKAGGIYDGYKSDTIKLAIGGTSIYLSVYNSPMIRNGISVETGSLKGANGVVVNALSAGAMTLRSLSSVEPVSTRDSLKAVTKVETFVDHDGLRSRNIVTYK